MKEAGLTNLGVHKITRPGDDCVGRLLRELDAPGGRAFIERFAKVGITVEYELHTLEWLLPRSLFASRPELFRVNADGARTPDCNLCPSSSDALEIVAANAYKLAKLLRQQSDNYFFWPDDAANAVCHCEKCRANGYTGSDQYMLIVNAIAEGLRVYNPHARAAYIAYADALTLPTVKPCENVFLEFAPMDRNHFKPLTDPDEERGRRYVELLKKLLTVFDAKRAHVLEYWLDNALFSGYKMPPVKVPFDAAVADMDTAFYTSLGIKNIKTFGSYIGAEYFKLHGTPPLKEYGEILKKYV